MNSAGSSPYNNINLPYEKDFVKGEETQPRGAMVQVQPSAPMAYGRKDVDVELSALSDDIYPGKLMNFSGNNVAGTGEGNRLPQKPQVVYRSAADIECEYFRKLINVGVFSNLIKVQTVGAIVILIAQVILYATSDEFWKVLVATGIGFWAPIVFFAPTCWLTYLTMKTPSGCVVGSALACHILSVVIGLVLIIMSMIHMSSLGRYKTIYSGNGSSPQEYDPEATARVFVAFMMIGAADVTVASLIASIQYCRITCCGRANISEP